MAETEVQDKIVITRLSNAPIGYGVGAGGTVTQITSKATGVTLNKQCGQITTHAANLSTLTVVTFTLTNSFIALGDQLVLNHTSGGTVGSYTFCSACAAGSATISITNITAGTLGEAIVIQFAILKTATT